MISIVDYGVGNLFSLQSSLKKIGEESVITGDREKILMSDDIILPGVGAFGDAAKKLETTGLGKTVKEAAEEGKPVLGICLGMQLLVDESLEYGRHEGLGLIPGKVVPLSDTVKFGKIPHMGWNSLRFVSPSKLYRYVSEGDYVYFVHSYQVKTDRQYVSATVEYEGDVTASIEYNNVFATQFHPEKSGNVGLKILKAFCETRT